MSAVVGDRGLGHTPHLVEVTGKAGNLYLHSAGRWRSTFREGAALTEEAFKRTYDPAGILLFWLVVNMGDAQMMPSQFVECGDAMPPQPSDDSGKHLEVAENGSNGILVIGLPLNELIQQRPENGQGAQGGTSSGTELDKKWF